MCAISAKKIICAMPLFPTYHGYYKVVTGFEENLLPTKNSSSTELWTRSSHFDEIPVPSFKTFLRASVLAP